MLTTYPRDRGGSSHLLLGPELVKHLLDLQPPVLLQRVEGLQGHLKHGRLFDGQQPHEDTSEGRATVGVRAPALWGWGEESIWLKCTLPFKSFGVT